MCTNLVVLRDFVLLLFFNVEQIPTRRPMPSTPGSEVT